MGNFTPPAFATVPTHASCGAFAWLLTFILPPKASRAFPPWILIYSFRRGDWLSWKDSLQDLKLKKHGYTNARCSGCPKGRCKSTDGCHSQSRRIFLGKGKFCTLIVDVHNQQRKFQTQMPNNKNIATAKVSSSPIAVSRPCCKSKLASSKKKDIASNNLHMSCIGASWRTRSLSLVQLAAFNDAFHKGYCLLNPLLSVATFQRPSAQFSWLNLHAQLLREIKS